MGAHNGSVRRTAWLAAAMVAGSTVFAPQALAGGDPAGPPAIDEDVTPVDGNEDHAPNPNVDLLTPRCFGLPATIVMTAPGDQLGTAGDDVIIGTSGEDEISSLGGRDRVCAGAGNDEVHADRDPLTGGWYPEIIVIGDDPSDDFIDGEDGSDTIAAGAGDDEVWGGDGLDYLYGYAGNDVIFGGDHQDFMSCGAGDDAADGGRGATDWVDLTGHGCESLVRATPSVFPGP